MNKTKLALIILAVYLLGMGLVFFTYGLFFVSEYRYLPTEFSVTDEIVAGLNGDRDAVKFGTVTKGNMGIRYVDLEHKRPYPVKVEVSVLGEGTEWIGISKNDFKLYPNDKTTLTFTLSVPGNAPVKDYSGLIQFKFRRAFQ